MIIYIELRVSYCEPILKMLEMSSGQRALVHRMHSNSVVQAVHIHYQTVTNDFLSTY
jgi:hypothetical protein